MWEKPIEFIKPVLLTVWNGGHIYVFGVGVSAAFLTGLFLFWREIRRTSHNEERQFDVFFAASIFGILLARLLYVFLHASTFKPTLLKTILLFSFPGVEEIGFWVGFFFIWLLYSIRNKLKFFELFRVMVIPLYIAYTIITLFSVFKEGQWYYLLAAIPLTVFFFVLEWMGRLIKQDKLPLQSLFYTFVIAVSLSRLVVDFFIADKVYLMGTPLTVMQGVYIVTFLVGLCWWGQNRYFKYLKSRKKHKQSDY